ncbi:monovalent cation/H(+) antiporter subunit G [Marispirochaeta aestuarii]|uniref:monovalent cation/H(+) antiporter subunit G n=1 Tax=Marispirochaeta aestuarii TaxID=1963862 RepID=UPI0029C7FBB0|nr:monovalent cation/H(+) antiporter subunit G [Marispirochaeta aestuarii]
MTEIIGALLVLAGALFLFLAALGLIRMPDVYNRMQAGTKATTLGSMLIFIGFSLYNPGQWQKYLLLILFIFLTNPLSSHALARAAHFSGIPALLEKYGSPETRRDDLREAGEPEQGGVR